MPTSAIRSFSSDVKIKGRLNMSRTTAKASYTDGSLMKAGTSTSKVSSSADSMKFLSFYFNHTGTGGYGLYLRDYISAAGKSNDAFRSFATVNDVAADTVRGAHISLSQGTTGSVTGLGAAIEATLHINTSGTAAGTLYGIKSAINSDSAASDPAGATTLAYYSATNQGDATGGADVDTDAVLLHIDGHTIGNGNMVEQTATAYALSELTHGIKIKIGSTVYYLLASTFAPSAT